jgi:hypothetical protein
MRGRKKGLAHASFVKEDGSASSHLRFFLPIGGTILIENEIKTLVRWEKDSAETAV